MLFNIYIFRKGGLCIIQCKYKSDTHEYAVTKEVTDMQIRDGSYNDHQCSGRQVALVRLILHY